MQQLLQARCRAVPESERACPQASPVGRQLVSVLQECTLVEEALVVGLSKEASEKVVVVIVEGSGVLVGNQEVVGQAGPS